MLIIIYRRNKLWHFNLTTAVRNAGTHGSHQQEYMSARNAVQIILMLITIRQENNDMRYNYNDRPSPHSFGDTGTMYRQQKAEKESFKKEELQKELRQEDRENESSGRL